MRPVSAVTNITNLEENPVKGKAEKKSGKRIGYNYIILRSLKESQKNDVVTCLYIKSLTDFGICVIKEGSYGDSKDKHGRDIKDRLIWQRELHEKLQDKVRIPRLLGSFEENGNFYLVLERIRGKSIYKACKEKHKVLRNSLIAGNKLGLTFLNYMVQLVALLEQLHEQQVIHRDVTATNFMITPSGKVAVIDMELSYSLQMQFPAPPFQLGTYGYMSPEQEITQPPAVEQDTFSAAAIILQMWSGISPSKLTNSPVKELAGKVRFFISDKIFADTIIQCLHPDPTQRPKLSTLRQVITSYIGDIKSKKQRTTSISKAFQQDEILDTIQQAIGTFATPLLADEEKGWFSENTSIVQHPDKKSINKAWYTSFYKGACGVIYMLSKAHKLGFDVSMTRPYINKGINLIETKYIEYIEEATPGLHFGCAGIAAVIATAIREGLEEPKAEYFDWINQLIKKESQGLGFQYGITGQGIAYWQCQPFLKANNVQEQLTRYTSHLLNIQEKDGSWVRSVKDNKNRITRGFASGVSGIIYFLLEYANQYKSKEALESAQKGLQWLMKKSIKQGGAIQWRSSADKEIAPWWCEGAAGIALTFLKAYSLTSDPRYSEYATGALNNHDTKITNNNISQCHGLSGLGEIYLEAYRILQKQEWLERADWIAQLLMHLKKSHNVHGPYWLAEHERQPVADFMIGNSGVIHFLMRYCFPDKIGFPLLP